MNTDSTEIIVCSSCGTKNRIRAGVLGGIFRCASCQSPLQVSTHIGLFARIRKSLAEFSCRAARLLAVLTLYTIPVWAAYHTYTTSTPTKAKQISKQSTPRPLPAVVVPASGSNSDNDELKRNQLTINSRIDLDEIEREFGITVTDDEIAQQLANDPDYDPERDKREMIRDLLKYDPFRLQKLSAATAELKKTKKWKLADLVEKKRAEKNPIINKAQLATQFQEPEQPLPKSGELRVFTNRKRLAPFKIKPSNERHFLIKLDDSLTDEPVLTIFVRSGTTVEVAVPLGTFKVKYTSGSSWYGYEHFFGPKAGYNIASSDFTFSDKTDHYEGHTITLYTLPNGNLKMQKIKPEQF